MAYRKDKLYRFKVAESGVLVRNEFSLDRKVTRVLGIALSSDFPDYLYYRGTFSMMVSNREVSVEGTEAKRFMFSTATSMDDRMHQCDLPSGDGKFLFNYQDTEHLRAKWDDLEPKAYWVNVYLDCEYEE